MSVLSLLHTSRTKIQAYKHQVQSEIPEYDSKNGLSALCWSAQHNELERVRRASTDQALLNLRQDVWLVCCRNSPPSNPYIAHRTSWAIGWVCLENVTEIAGSAPPSLEPNSFFWFHRPSSSHYTAWAVRLFSAHESGFRYNSSVLRQWRMLRHSEFSTAISLKRRKWRHSCIKKLRCNLYIFPKIIPLCYTEFV